MGLKVSNVGVYGFQYAIKALKRFYNSNLSSSSETISFGDGYIPNKNDLAIMRTHVKESNSKAKFTRFIQVYFDVDAPLHWWLAFKDYKIGVEKITDPINKKLFKEPLTINSFDVDKEIPECVQIINKVIEGINPLITLYNTSNAAESKRAIVRKIKMVLPHSFIISGTITTNYQTLRSICLDRKESKSDEWISFHQFIESLPYAEFLISAD